MKNIFSTIILITLISCGRDHFNQVLEIELPEEESVLAITSHIKNNERILTTFVSHTQGTLDNEPFSTFPDGSVQLFQDGNLVGEFEYENPSENHINELDFPLNAPAGTAFRIEVSAPDYDPVSAEQVMPNAVPILNTTYESLGTIDFEGNDQDELTIKFKDPTGEENFYSFNVIWALSYRVEGDTTIYDTFNHLYIDTLDPLVEYGADGAWLLNDRSFDGDEYNVRFFFYPLQIFFGNDVEIVKNEIHTTMSSLTNDKYLYLKTLEAFRSNRDNPFSEPVTVHNNIDGGIGIFTLENSEVFVLDIGE